VRGEYLLSYGHHRFSTIQYPLFRFNGKKHSGTQMNVEESDQDVPDE
jgi:hypothetical protein